jgi:hypothetical protein
MKGQLPRQIGRRRCISGRIDQPQSAPEAVSFGRSFLCRVLNLFGGASVLKDRRPLLVTGGEC